MRAFLVTCLFFMLIAAAGISAAEGVIMSVSSQPTLFTLNKYAFDFTPPSDCSGRQVPETAIQCLIKDKTIQSTEGFKIDVKVGTQYLQTLAGKDTVLYVFDSYGEAHPQKFEFDGSESKMSAIFFDGSALRIYAAENQADAAVALVAALFDEGLNASFEPGCLIAISKDAKALAFNKCYVESVKPSDYGVQSGTLDGVQSPASSLDQNVQKILESLSQKSSFDVKKLPDDFYEKYFSYQAGSEPRSDAEPVRPGEKLEVSAPIAQAPEEPQEPGQTQKPEESPSTADAASCPVSPTPQHSDTFHTSKNYHKKVVWTGGQGYRYRIYKGGLHAGIDFMIPTGTPLKAIEGGVVEQLFTNPGYACGLEVMVRTQGNSPSDPNWKGFWYCHMSEIKVKEGQRVSKGDVLGLSGNTGRSDGPHVHVVIAKLSRDKQGVYYLPLDEVDGLCKDKVAKKNKRTTTNSKTTLEFASEQKSLAGKKIAIDAGHGTPWSKAKGSYNGQTDATSTLHERDITLATAKKLKALVEAQGGKVVMTRSSDADVSLSQRAAIANKANADAFVSIHVNCDAKKAVAEMKGVSKYSAVKTGDPRICSAGVIYSHKGSEKSKQLAESIAESIGAKAHPDGPSSLFVGTLVTGIKDKPIPLAVLGSTKMPAILVEVGTIADDSIATEAKQQELAEKILAGVVKVFGTAATEPDKEKRPTQDTGTQETKPPAAGSVDQKPENQDSNAGGIAVGLAEPTSKITTHVNKGQSGILAISAASSEGTCSLDTNAVFKKKEAAQLGESVCVWFALGEKEAEKFQDVAFAGISGWTGRYYTIRGAIPKDSNTKYPNNYEKVVHVGSSLEKSGANGKYAGYYVARLPTYKPGSEPIEGVFLRMYIGVDPQKFNKDVEFVIDAPTKAPGIGRDRVGELEVGVIQAYEQKELPAAAPTPIATKPAKPVISKPEISGDVDCSKVVNVGYKGALAQTNAAIKKYVNLDYGGLPQVPWQYVCKIIRDESSFSPTISSPAGAVGLMQLMPGTASSLQTKYGKLSGYNCMCSNNIRGVEENICCGIAYLREGVKQYNGDLLATAARYNGGDGGARAYIKSGGKPFVWADYRDRYATYHYVQSVKTFLAKQGITTDAPTIAKDKSAARAS